LKCLHCCIPFGAHDLITLRKVQVSKTRHAYNNQQSDVQRSGKGGKSSLGELHSALSVVSLDVCVFTCS
jgi:hypothetical protein